MLRFLVVDGDEMRHGAFAPSQCKTNAMREPRPRLAHGRA